jgi:hypothetical protein
MDRAVAASSPHHHGVSVEHQSGRSPDLTPSGGDLFRILRRHILFHQISA